MYKVLKRTCLAIVLPLKSFVSPRPPSYLLRFTVKSPDSHLARSHVARNLSHDARNFSNVARKKKSSRLKKQILKRSEFQTVNRQ